MTLYFLLYLQQNSDLEGFIARNDEDGESIQDVDINVHRRVHAEWEESAATSSIEEIALTHDVGQDASPVGAVRISYANHKQTRVLSCDPPAGSANLARLRGSKKSSRRYFFF